MKTYLLTVTGLVQGIGMRPSVCLLGRELGLDGIVRNSGGVLEIEVNLESGAVDEYIHRLYKLCPRKARIDSVNVEEIEKKQFDGFSVENSIDNELIPSLPYDLGICEDCRKALLNPKDRRYKYPFLTCASCGPRYTIMNSIPYDRENTSMKEFSMCESCQREYFNPDSRYFYAQTLSCPNCGPSLFLYNTSNPLETISGEEAFNKVVNLLREGQVVAVKNIGGFHFVCDALNEEAVERVRALKKRRLKPLAISVANTELARKYANFGPLQEQALNSDARPILLCDKRKSSLPFNVCANSDKVGIMLPANALQVMLNDEFEALVMTSANVSSEPIIIEDRDLWGFEKLWILSNNRAIITPVDDSILGTRLGEPYVLRRARGYVPEIIETGLNVESTVLFTGADVKSSLGLSRGSKLFLSQCLGDMEQEKVVKEAKATVSRLEKNHNLKHELTIGDAHPGYMSSNIFKLDEKIYHHEAHVASVLLEHRLLNEQVIAFSFDGTGYGRDGNSWGGEAFLYQAGAFERVSHVKSFNLAGGNEASRDGRLVLASIILSELKEHSQNSDKLYKLILSLGFSKEEINILTAAINQNVNTAICSSMGRVFDAVSALLGVCPISSYEGEAAIELEFAARKAAAFENEKIDFSELLKEDELNSFKIIEYLLHKKKEGVLEQELAFIFHKIVVAWMKQLVVKYGIKKVVFAGGTANNELLITLLNRELEKIDAKLYVNKLLPSGDDGIVAGQLALFTRNYKCKKED